MSGASRAAGVAGGRMRGAVRTMALAAAVGAAAALGAGCASRGAERDPSAMTQTAGTADSTAVVRASIHDILTSPRLAGRTVRVTGFCAGYPADVIPGSPPLTRSDWILEEGGVAIYVTGAYPPGCSPTARSEKPVTIDAVVVEDSVAVFGGERSVRRYLARVAD